jgi:hypothetical protein
MPWHKSEENLWTEPAAAFSEPRGFGYVVKDSGKRNAKRLASA